MEVIMKLKREFIDDILDPNFNEYNIPNSDIETTCLNCGFTEKVPDLYCSKCEKETAIPSSWLK